MRSTQMNDTHATATMPMGKYHFPRLKGPGTNLSRPDVMRKSIGAAYETYKPITADLDVSHRCQIAPTSDNVQLTRQEMSRLLLKILEHHKCQHKP